MNILKKFVYFNIVPSVGYFFKNNNKFINVIYYHDVVNHKGFGSQQTNVDIFKAQMQYLHDNEYVTYTFDELENPENLKFHKKHVLIAFDDGWASNYVEIFEFMKSLKIKYNVYLTVGMIGVDVNYLNWQQVREMHNSGYVGFGAHTYTHQSMKEISVIDANLEIVESDKKFKNELGYEPHDFCYPFGHFSEESNEYLVKCSNYTRIYTSQMSYSYLKDGNIIFGRNSIVNEEPFKVFKNKLKGYYNVFNLLAKLKL